MSIHHITNEVVADKPIFKGSEAYKQLLVLFATEDSILVAHNLSSMSVCLTEKAFIH